MTTSSLKHTSGIKHLFSYDFSNRLVCKEEVHKDEHFATHSKYDRLSNCIATTDSYGRETRYTYDEFGRVVKIKAPPLLNEEGAAESPVMTKAYNVAGHPICVTHPKGRQIHTQFNIRGQPLYVSYPDGSNEKFLYRLDGQCMFKQERNGTQLATQETLLVESRKKRSSLLKELCSKLKSIATTPCIC